MTSSGEKILSHENFVKWNQGPLLKSEKMLLKGFEFSHAVTTLDGTIKK
jgi:hypothetical protein